MNDPTSARNKADFGVIDPAAESAVDTSAAEIPSLQDELESLDGQSIQRQLATIQRLYRRSLSIVGSSIPSLIYTSSKPLPSTHLLQLLLKSLTGSFLRLFSDSLSGDDNAAEGREGILYGALDTTAQRILIGLLTSNRVDKGCGGNFIKFSNWHGQTTQLKAIQIGRTAHFMTFTSAPSCLAAPSRPVPPQ